VDSLSKAYRIGLKEEIPDTLLGAAKGMLRAPWRNLQRLRRMNTYRPARAGRNGHGFADRLSGTGIHPEDEDTIWAIRDVSFEVREGEVVGVIGRNGAGKSTLLKVISRITEPTRGRAELLGRTSSLLEVGTGFHPELTGRENVYMNGTILGMTKHEIDRKFDEIVEFSGVEKFLDTPVKRYSSGMTVRLAFAVAAHLEPEILIIDEVLAVGDAAFQQRCLGKMRDVAGSGRTVLFVSHNMVAVEALCHRAILLGGGRLSLDGSIAEVVREYLRSVHDEARRQSRVPEEGSHLKFLGLIDESDAPTNVYRLGATLRLRAVVAPQRPLLRPHLGIGINNVIGTRLISSNTAALPGGLPEIARPTTIECTIPQLPLAPGQYTIKVVLQDRGTNVEVLENALTFSVLDADVHGTASGFHAGLCYAPAEWRAFGVNGNRTGLALSAHGK
jgi:lipopolysaccharide transport system ATP-binding protein